MEFEGLILLFIFIVLAVSFDYLDPIFDRLFEILSWILLVFLEYVFSPLDFCELFFLF